jgi:hypothetical protein
MRAVWRYRHADAQVFTKDEKRMEVGTGVEGREEEVSLVNSAVGVEASVEVAAS